MNIFCRNKDKLDESKRMGMVMVMTITTTVDSSKPPSRSHGDATEQLLDKSNQSLPPVVGRERGCLAFVMEKIQGQNKLCVMYLISI
ncbi:unnamed protein product [Brassica rapa subsp. trilocularis]